MRHAKKLGPRLRGDERIGASRAGVMTLWTL
jgi:hypothetical protein